MEEGSNDVGNKQQNGGGKASNHSSSMLTPSQARKPNKNSKGAANAIGNNAKGNPSNAGNGKGRNNNNNRRRRNAKNNSKNNNNKPQVSTDDNNGGNTNANDAPEGTNKTTNNNNGNVNNSNNGKKQRERQRQRGNKMNGDASNEKGDENGNGNGNGNANVDGDGSEDQNKNDSAKKEHQNQIQKNKKKRKPRKKNKHPWRRHIPEGTVDPITLDNLDTLDYPPFALCADEPYVPVPVWPVPLEPDSSKIASENKGNNTDNSGESPPVKEQQQNDDDVEHLNRQRLADQWGEHMLPSQGSATKATDLDKKQKAPSSSTTPTPPLSKRPLNLFDGRALAFYMVSQLQFIDPFTRRDLTRPELLNLDRYLARYGSYGTDFENNNGKNKRNKKKQKQQIKVTDAYDAKGITLSSAGAAAATAQGRADIMQQMAQQLLNSLFVGQSSVSAIANENGAEEHRQEQHPSQRQQAQAFSLQEQYAAMQRQEQQEVAEGERRYERGGFGISNNFANGFYQSHDGSHVGSGGFMIIDDDENPELRGRSHNDFPSLGANSNSNNSAYGVPGGGGSPFYSTSHIADRHRGHIQSTGPGAFPALPRPAAASSTNTNRSAPSSSVVVSLSAARPNSSASGGKNAAKTKKSKTLSKISGIVKKTTAEERQRQWEAREAARRKAAMSNLTFGMSHPVASGDPSQGLLTAPTPGSAGGSATEEQMQRNRAFAEALGVKPTPQRHYASGWARPTTIEGQTTELIEELEAALYPDAFIAEAREHRMQILVKLERRWKFFLNDDKAASLPLNRMDRPTRKFVHQYAEFWRFKTESFDPEPNRYIHCVKLADTRMPRPLLSDVARNWRGPSLLPLPDSTRTIASVMHDHTSQQTAGQTSRSHGEVVPRLVAAASQPLRSAMAISSSKGDLVALGDAAVQNSRSDFLLADKERPQLKLLPRSVPLELLPFEEQLEQEATAAYNLTEDLRKRDVLLEERRKKEKEVEEKKRQALEDAFASDDEDDDGKGGNVSDSDSEWGEEQEALFDESDEE